MSVKAAASSSLRAGAFAADRPSRDSFHAIARLSLWTVAVAIAAWRTPVSGKHLLDGSGTVWLTHGKARRAFYCKGFTLPVTLPPKVTLRLECGATITLPAWALLCWELPVPSDVASVRACRAATVQAAHELFATELLLILDGYKGGFMDQPAIVERTLRQVCGGVAEFAVEARNANLASDESRQVADPRDGTLMDYPSASQDKGRSADDARDMARRLKELGIGDKQALEEHLRTTWRTVGKLSDDSRSVDESTQPFVRLARELLEDRRVLKDAARRLWNAAKDWEAVVEKSPIATARNNAFGGKSESTPGRLIANGGRRVKDELKRIRPIDPGSLPTGVSESLCFRLWFLVGWFG